MDPRRALRPLAPLLLAAVLTACASEPPQGWAPLWEESWQLLQVDDLWLRGLTLEEDRTFEITEAGAWRFRARLANRDMEPSVVRLDGPGTSESWTLPPGGELAVDALLEPGSYRLRGSNDVIAGRPRVGIPLERPRLLVLLLADTLRDDHVNPDLTPGIVEAFSSGSRWTDAMANSPWTIPSVASMLTSRCPLDLSLPDGGLIGVPEGAVSLVEALERAGFAAGAAVANYTVHAQNGFARGFSSFRVPTIAAGAEMPDASWVVAEGRRFLAAHQGEDAFLYLHFMDPHEPFRDHGAGLPSPPSMATLAHRRREATAEEGDLIRALYRGETRHLDRQLAPFLRELPPDAVVSLVSDHGEVLGEHGAWGHGLTLFQEVVAVPLLLRGPGIQAGTVQHPVQLLDLAPTLLAAMGVPRGEEMAGRSLLAREDSAPRREPLLTSTFYAGPLRWAWRDGATKFRLHTAPQAEGAPGGREIREDDPLPHGAFAYSLPGEEWESAPVSPQQALRLARPFAHSAGRMVPGITLLLVGVEGPVELSFEASGDLEPVHLWGVSATELQREGRHWTLRTAAAFPLAGVAFQGETEVEIRPLGGSVPWPAAGAQVLRREGHGGPTALDRPGVHLWWNEERTVVVSGQQETERRLRALGYL